MHVQVQLLIKFKNDKDISDQQFIDKYVLWQRKILHWTWLKEMAVIICKPKARNFIQTYIEIFKKLISINDKLTLFALEHFRD